MKTLMRIGLCCGLPLVMGTAAAAQGTPDPDAPTQARRAATHHRAHIGVHAAYDFKVEDFALGAQASVPITHHFELYPSFDYYFADPGSLWQLNADLKYSIRETGHWFYVGGGIGFARRSVGSIDNTDVGANLIGGLDALVWRRVHPYAEARLIFSDETRFQLGAGLNFTIF